ALTVTTEANSQGRASLGSPTRPLVLKAVSMIKNGKALPDRDVDRARLSLDGSNFSVNIPGRSGWSTKGTYTIDPSQSPKHMDLVCTSGVGKGLSLKGIYKVDDGKLTICYGGPGKPRPTAFTSKPGSEQRLFVMQKEKKNSGPSGKKKRNTDK